MKSSFIGSINKEDKKGRKNEGKRYIKENEKSVKNQYR